MSLCIVLRSCGERTADAALESIRRSMPNVACAHVYGASPHDAALQTVKCMKSFVTDHTSFLILDGDTILYEGKPVLENMDVPLARFILVDRFEKSRHYFGPRLISSSLVAALCEACESVEKNREWYCDPMGVLLKATGVEEKKMHQTLGLHDYMQFHRDIFRKFIYRGWRLNDSDLFSRFSHRLRQDDTLESRAARAGLRFSQEQSHLSELGSKDGKAHFATTQMRECPPMIDTQELENAYLEFTQHRNVTIRKRDPKSIVKKPEK
jgi:hypothetical protein